MSVDKIQNTSANVDLSAFAPERYCHAGLEADSNLQSTGSAGGPEADSSFVRNSGGGDDAGLRDSNLGAGGKSIA
jgi:hypothetical protein